ncbi:methyltransferase [Candidatus Woesearchaeota archaeon]|nr:methyltransferase [Candidatus Woesearchaeota archaeon]
MYKPREDSELLAKTVEKLAYGKVLDMGTGSGIQAIAAAKKKEVESVLAVDINKDAIDYASKNNSHKKIRYAISNLFSSVKGNFDMSANEASDHARKQNVFDTIIFNPPYLPCDDKVKDVALDGGKKGYEMTVKFLEQTKEYLNKDGQILLLFSTLTKKDVIDKTVMENCYLYEETDFLKLDFETLYVYKIKKLESMIKGIKKPEFLARGKRGIIYTGKYSNKKVGIKIKNPKSEAHARIEIEGRNLKIVNKLGIGPILVKESKDFVMYEFVDGILFPEFIEKSNKEEIKKVVLNLFEQMRILDKNKINKEEMTNPYKHIVVTEKSTVLLDFERANRTIKPNNVNQFCQYIISENLSKILKKKGFDINKKGMINNARKYKQKYDEKEFKKIIALIK